MHKAEHCRLCDHQQINLKNGTTCGLTRRKPEFSNSCPDIDFSQKLEPAIKEVNAHYENIKRKALLTYIHSFIFLFISISVFYGGWYLGKYVLETGALSAIPMIIFGIGFMVLPLAFGPLNYHRRDLKLALKKKQKLDGILAAYQVDYTIDIHFGKERHGSQEVFTDLEIQRY